MTDFEMLMLCNALKLSVAPGGLLVFVVAKEQIDQAHNAIQKVVPQLKARNIAALLYDDSTTLIMVPEARRVLALPRESNG
jgi:hypothetical protein